MAITLKKDPSAGGPTTDGTTIFTDQWNKLVDILSGTDTDTIDPRALPGVHDVWIGATGMWPSTTGGCASLAKREIVSGVDIQTLNFDGATNETAQFTISLPRNFDNSTLTFEVYWTSATGTALTTIWQLSVLARSEGDSLNGTYTDLTSVTDTWTANNALHISPTSVDLGITGMVDSDLLQCKITRDASTDTATVDAELIGIMLHITTDAATAA